MTLRLRETDYIFEAWTGPMFSGKSSALQYIVRKMRLRNENVLYLHPDENGRDLTSSVETHNGCVEDAIRASHLSKVRDLVAEHTPTVVVIDEAQFIADLAKICFELIDMKIDVYIGGLNLNFAGKPWPAMQEVYPFLTRHHILTSSCETCPSKAATHSHLLGDAPEDSLEPVPGGHDRYQARCRKCFYEED